jgi:hypothetical protein
VFRVAKFSDQPGFGSPDAGHTIASIRAAGARWIGLSHGGNPEVLAAISSKPDRRLNFPSTGAVFFPLMLADTSRWKG